MDAKARKERNQYMKQWRSKNKNKVKAIQDRYWEKKAAIENEEESVCDEEKDEIEIINEWNNGMKGNGYHPTIEEEMNLNVDPDTRYVGKGLLF